MTSTDQGHQVPIRVGIIGAGLRGAAYFRNIPANLADAVRLVAIADPSADKRAAFAQMFATGSTPTGYDDGLDLLQSEQLDAVVVASPNYQHLPVRDRGDVAIVAAHAGEAGTESAQV